MTNEHDLAMDNGMYLDNVMEHYRDPHNHGPIPNDATFSHREVSLSCGDSMEFAVKFGDDGRVEKAWFDGTGCAISTASASMLTDAVRGKTLAELRAMGKEDIFALLGFEVGVSRLGCALLGLKTLELGLENYLERTMKRG